MTTLIKKQGRNGGTWAHLYILLDAAAKMDAGFKVQMYHTVVTSQILQWRDDGGDAFIGLNAAMDAYLPEREDKPSNKGIHINAAKMLRHKILHVE